MIPVVLKLVTLSLLLSPMVEPLPFIRTHSINADEIGWWSQYAEQPTKDQIAYHGYKPVRARLTSRVSGYIATLDCSKVGSFAWIKINDSDWLRVRVFDCLGGDGNPSWWRENRVIGEIDYYLAVQHDVVREGGVKAEIAWD